MSQIIYGVLILALCYVLACRVDKMVRGVTKPRIFWQHFLLGVSAIASLALRFTTFEPWASPALAFGVLVFFLFSVQRWRRAAPKDTERHAGA